jgi:hypothetical protein
MEDFLRDFKENVKLRNEKDRISFYNKLLDRDLTYLREELNRVKNKSDEFRVKYNSIDFSSISLDSLRKKFLESREDYLPKLLSNREVFRSKILDEFEINEASYNQKILPYVKKLTGTRFIDLNKNKKSRLDFLKESL